MQRRIADWLFAGAQVAFAPGHAPSHVVLHQPDRGLLLSGDHLLGRVSLYYDYGYTPDPAGEFSAVSTSSTSWTCSSCWPDTAAPSATPPG